MIDTRLCSGHFSVRVGGSLRRSDKIVKNLELRLWMWLLLLLLLCMFQNFLYKCLGVILRKSTKKDLVTKHLDIIFSSVKHTDQVEREVLCGYHTRLRVFVVVVVLLCCVLVWFVLFCFVLCSFFLSFFDAEKICNYHFQVKNGDDVTSLAVENKVQQT